MRIRSIKPEFWRSRDITSMGVDDRLLFIGLWSYVDDNGVGIDDEASIIGDLFAPDMISDARETFARVSRGLQTLSERGLITRYECNGKRFLQVNAWSAHQRIDKPAKPRYPRYDVDSRESRESVAKVSENYAPGTGEQGNRGTGEQRNSKELLSGAKAPDRGSLIPYDWQPNQKHKDLAVSLRVDIEREAMRFRQHAVATQRRLSNWNTAFTNWMQKGVLMQQQRQGVAPVAAVRSRREANLDVVAQLEAEAMRSSGMLEVTA